MALALAGVCVGGYIVMSALHLRDRLWHVESGLPHDGGRVFFRLVSGYCATKVTQAAAADFAHLWEKFTAPPANTAGIVSFCFARQRSGSKTLPKKHRMTGSPVSYPAPPIVEAVLDIDCDLPPGLDFGALQKEAAGYLHSDYPHSKMQFSQQHTLKQESGTAPVLTSVQGISAFMFHSADERQIVQIRPAGFSFNRLRPYTSLDDYLPEIRRQWEFFVRLAAPLIVRKVGLRYINRLPLPSGENGVQLDNYLRHGPHIADEAGMGIVGFLHQHHVRETRTGHEAIIVLTTQLAQPGDGPVLPVILDIHAYHREDVEPENWGLIEDRLRSLRRLKNLIFESTITPLCRNLFQLSA